MPLCGVFAFLPGPVPSVLYPSPTLVPPLLFPLGSSTSHGAQAPWELGPLPDTQAPTWAGGWRDPARSRGLQATSVGIFFTATSPSAKVAEWPGSSRCPEERSGWSPRKWDYRQRNDTPQGMRPETLAAGCSAEAATAAPLALAVSFWSCRWRTLVPLLLSVATSWWKVRFACGRSAYWCVHMCVYVSNVCVIWAAGKAWSLLT